MIYIHGLHPHYTYNGIQTWYTYMVHIHDIHTYMHPSTHTYMHTYIPTQTPVQQQYKANTIRLQPPPPPTGGGGGNVSLWDSPSTHIILKTITITGGYIHRIQIYYHHNRTPFPHPQGGAGVYTYRYTQTWGPGGWTKASVNKSEPNRSFWP